MLYNLGRQEFGNQANLGNLPTKGQVYQLLQEWVKNEKLLLHMAQVGGLLKAWALEKGLSEQDQWLWQASGLLHDADWDQWPDQHCNKIITYGEDHDWDPRLLHAIASHGPRHFGVTPVSELDKMIYALDELSGFVHAVSLVRPEGYQGMAVKSVKKKMKEKSFAAQVDREEIADGASTAGVALEDLIGHVITHQPGITFQP